MWLVVVSERLVSLLRLLARLISPNGQTVDRRSYLKLVAVPMGNDRLLNPKNRHLRWSQPEAQPMRDLAEAVEREFLGLPLLTHSDPPSVPPNRFFLEPLEPGENPK